MFSLSTATLLPGAAILRAEARPGTAMKLIQTIPLPKVEGYFDHMAGDIKGQRLFVTGEHQRTFEVIDLQSGQVIRTITGFGGDPRKALYLPKTKESWGGDGEAHVKSHDGASSEIINSIPLS